MKRRVYLNARRQSIPPSGSQVLEIVNIAPDDEGVFSWTSGCVNAPVEDKHTRVLLALSQSPRLEPFEERSLPSAPSLRESVDGPIYAPHLWVSILPLLRVRPRGG